MCIRDRYYWDKKDSIRSIGNVKIIEKGEKRRLYADELYIFSPDSTTQFLQLSGSSEVFNITKTKPSEDSPIMSFEDEMKGEIIEIFIKQDTLRTLNIYGMAIADYHVIKDSLLMGLNNVSGDSISINFDKNELIIHQMRLYLNQKYFRGMNLQKWRSQLLLLFLQYVVLMGIHTC